MECRVHVGLDVERVAWGHGHELGDARQGVGVLGGESVEGAVVDDPPALVPVVPASAPQLVAVEAGLVDEKAAGCGG